MLNTKRKPVTVGEMLVEEFMEPLHMTQTDLAERSGLPRKHVNELCRGRRAVTADTALILSRVFGNSADFWLNTQRRTDIWEALHTVKEGYQSRSVAEVETKRGTSDPTYLYYTLGKLEIMKLREDLKKKEGPAFDLERFHDDFMRQGFAPIKVIRKAMLHNDSPVL